MEPPLFILHSERIIQMFTKEIKYEDFNGIERHETLHFNVTKAELIEFTSTNGNLVEDLESIIKSQDPTAMMSTMVKIIMMGYGIKSEDGRRFVKSDKIREEFKQTNAYSELVMELYEDPNRGADIIKNMFPPIDEELRSKVQTEVEQKLGLDSGALNA